MNSRSLLALAGLILAAPLFAQEKITYNDQVMPILKNACLNCHNPDKKKAGLDLSTYSAAIAGSDNGKIVQSGNAANSLLLKCIKQTEDPKMPPKGDKLSDAEIAVIEKWIAGQLLESANGKVVAVSNNVQLAVVSLDRPAGPPPMPVGDLPLEPLVQAKRTNALVALAASPWAPLVAVGGQKQVILYNTDKLEALGVLPFPEGFPEVLRFSRNGQLLLTGGGLGGKSGKVVLWKVATGERAGEVGNEFDQVLGADVSPDHAHVALGGPTKLLKIYSTKDGKLEQSIKKHTDWVTAVAYSPDGRYLASADRSGGIQVWEGSTGKEFNSLPGHKLMVTALAFMPGVLASASEDGKISLWDVKEGKEIRSWAAHAGGVMSVDFTPDGRLVSSGRDKLAKVWDQNGKVLLTSPAFDDIALRAVMANERVIAGDWSGQIRVFNVADSKRLGDLTSNPPTIQENLAGVEKALAEAKAKLEPAVQAQTTAETQLQAAKSAAEKTRKDALAVLQEKQRVAQTESESAKAEVEKLPEGERPAMAGKLAEAQKKAEVAAKAAAEYEKTPLDAKTQPLEQVLAQAQTVRQQAEAAVQSATADLQRWQRAQAYMTVHRAKQSLADLTTRCEGLTAALQTALAPIDQVQADIAASEKSAAAAEAVSSAKAGEQGKAQTELEGAKQAVAEVETALANSAQRQKELQAASDKAAAETATVTASLEAKKKEVVSLQEAAEKLPAGSPERGVADAKLSGPKGELDRLQASSEVAATTMVAAKTSAENAAGEAKTASASVAKAKEALQAAEAKTAEMAKAVAAAKKAAEADAQKLAELRKNAPAVIAEAKAAKAKAEADAKIAAKELEAAKATAERAKAEYESRYRPAAQPIAKS